MITNFWRRFRFGTTNKLSVLLSIARDDLKSVEQFKDRYEVDMGSWHVPWEGKCSVCMAGAVMARTYSMDDEADVYPSDLSYNLKRRMSAVDWLRCGNVSSAASVMFGEEEAKRFEEFDRHIVHYEMNRDRFYDEIDDLIEDLRRAGL